MNRLERPDALVAVACIFPFECDATDSALRSLHRAALSVAVTGVQSRIPGPLAHPWRVLGPTPFPTSSVTVSVFTLIVGG
jgi:hypothetical protein